MSKADIIQAIQDAADVYYANPAIDSDARNAIKLAVGSPGEVLYIENQRLDSGSAWIDEPKVFPTFVEGIADWLGSQGDVSTIKSKLNELIGEYNQLLADHNSATVPSTATTVTVIP